jgi:RNA polymerase sigma-70 factor (ECF subfamily)
MTTADPETRDRMDDTTTNGTRSAWVEAALARHEAPLVAYAHRLVGDAHRARDVVQETFLRLCSEEPSRVDGHVGPWLFAVCRRLAIDDLRKEWRMTPTAQTLLDARPGRAEDPAETAATRDHASSALAALAALPENQREVLELRLRHGMSYAEISRVTGHTVTNVGFLLHVGMKALRARLGDDPAARDASRGAR